MKIKVSLRDNSPMFEFSLRIFYIFYNFSLFLMVVKDFNSHTNHMLLTVLTKVLDNVSS